MFKIDSFKIGDTLIQDVLYNDVLVASLERTNDYISFNVYSIVNAKTNDTEKLLMSDNMIKQQYDIIEREAWERAEQWGTITYTCDDVARIF